MPANVGEWMRRRVRTAREAAATRGDSGMSAIEFVLLTPVLFFMIVATVQFALYFFADHVAQAAAQAGARKARATAHDQPGAWRGERSEERRVGKECRARWRRERSKKKKREM